MMRHFSVYFLLHAVSFVLALFIGMGFIAGMWYPIANWLWADGWKWASFNLWFGYALVGIPIGIFAAGMLTVAEWSQRSEASKVNKILVFTLVAIFFVGVGLVAAQRIRQIFPIPDKTVPSPSAPVSFEYIPVEAVTRPASGVTVPPNELFSNTIRQHNPGSGLAIQH